MTIKCTQTDDGAWIVSDGFWLPGLYATEEAARKAANLPDDALQALSDRICRFDGENRRITMADLGEAE